MTIKLSENIRRFRKDRRMTQEQLAEILDVTAGAVYKWESGASMPEIRLLIQLAELFETSVDALLGYGWETGSMGEAARRLKGYYLQKDLQEGIPYAERALQKYPNSFLMVYRSALLYNMEMVTRGGKSAARAITLYERSIALIGQNTDPEISETVIRNYIAMCYCYLGQMDKAIELLQKNNVLGVNDAKIGLLMSQDINRAEESLKFLSDALHNYYARIYEVCIGYANAYGVLEEADKIEELMLWLLDMGKGLREPSVVNFMDNTSFC